MDEDGTCTNGWLEFANYDDVMEALAELTIPQLTIICDAKGWKVLSLVLPYLSFRRARTDQISKIASPVIQSNSKVSHLRGGKRLWKRVWVHMGPTRIPKFYTIGKA